MCKCISLLCLKKFAVVVTAIKLGWADLRSPGIYFIEVFFGARSRVPASFRVSVDLGFRDVGSK